MVEIFGIKIYGCPWLRQRPKLRYRAQGFCVNDEILKKKFE